MSDIPKFEQVLKSNIVVVSIKAGNQKVYNGCGQFEDYIFLYHSELNGAGHFDLITKMTGFTCQAYYCNFCQKSYSKRDEHSCSYSCNVCGRNNCKQSSQSQVKCAACNRMCRSENCLRFHTMKPVGKGNKKNQDLPSLCEQHHQCSDCGLLMEKRQKEDHCCGEMFCSRCQKHYRDEHHQCYIRSDYPDSLPNKLIFYDFESIQESGEHIPNLLVLQSACDNCEEESEVTSTSKCLSCGSRCHLCSQWNKEFKEYERYPCEGCGFRQQIFQGTHCVWHFVTWLLSEQNKNATVIAHNAKGYDNYFLYKQLISLGHVPQSLIFSGSKIMYMKIAEKLNIRFLDSINFLPMALAKLPKSFGLDELKKGYFPHLYNTTANQQVKLPHLPEQKYYSPDTMGEGARNAFLKWYK